MTDEVKNLGEPLTIEQLRGMDGEPVWVEFEDGSGGLWGIVHIAVFDQIVFPDGLHCTIGKPYYGRTYKAYLHQPVTIDLDAWEPCNHCISCENCENVFEQEYREPCETCIKSAEKKEKFEPVGFCKHCGRPLTPEAWAILEQRLRG